MLDNTSNTGAAILPIRCLQDNYAYLVVDRGAGRAAVIDPGAAEPVLARLRQEGLSLSHILLTHHHYDHSGGISALKENFPDACVAIHRADAGSLRQPVDLQLADGDRLRFGAHDFRVLHLPCHTRGHVAFLYRQAAFTGDTLFNAGCGKFFEGNADEMLANLEKLGALPVDTAIYCGHEYTHENLEYAARIEPDNPVIRQRLTAAAQAGGRFLVPAALALEKQSNPFLRLDEPALRNTTKTTSPVATLKAVYRIYYGRDSIQ